MSIIECIRQAERNGTLADSFNADDVFIALKNMPGCSYPKKTLQNFLPKHRTGNPTMETELFNRISQNPVKYELT